MLNLIQFYTFSEIKNANVVCLSLLSSFSTSCLITLELFPWDMKSSLHKTMRILNYFLSMQKVKHLLKSDRFFTAILVSKMWQITRLHHHFFYLSRIVQCCGSDFSKIRIYSIDPGPNTIIRVADLDTIFYTYGVFQYVFSGCGS